MSKMKRVIYADNAATTKLDSDALDAMMPYLMKEYANASQPYFFAKAAKKALADAKETIAGCIGADPKEIFLTSGGTESDNWALKSVLFHKSDQNRILTSSIEHKAVLNSCRALEGMSIPVEYLPVDQYGVLQPDTLRDSWKRDVALVSVMLSNNEIGTIEPIRELCKIAHERGALFHTDAVQAMGHIPIDVEDLEVDLLSASAHKFNGMKGSGFLYIRQGTMMEPFLDGGNQEGGLRAGTENVAAAVSMAIALKKNCDRMEKERKRLEELESIFIHRLSLSGVDFIRNGSKNHLPGNISISIKDSDGEMLLHRLDLMGICVSTGSACDSQNTKISHVIEAIQVPKEYAKGTIRISLGADNIVEDVNQISDALSKIIKG